MSDNECGGCDRGPCGISNSAASNAASLDDAQVSIRLCELEAFHDLIKIAQDVLAYGIFNRGYIELPQSGEDGISGDEVKTRLQAALKLVRGQEHG